MSFREIDDILWNSIEPLSSST